MPTPIPTTTVQSASLYFREGPSNKEYHAVIEPGGDGYIVTFAYGRRGSTLNTGTKTTAPVSLAEATKIFEKLVASKTAKGYRPSGAPAPVYQQHGTEGADTRIRCQILNPVEESELERLLTDDRHCLQQKRDGRRLLVRKEGDAITGIGSPKNPSHQDARFKRARVAPHAPLASSLLRHHADALRRRDGHPRLRGGPPAGANGRHRRLIPGQETKDKGQQTIR